MREALGWLGNAQAHRAFNQGAAHVSAAQRDLQHAANKEDCIEAIEYAILVMTTPRDASPTRTRSSTFSLPPR
jgi:hypothetical protein